MQPAVLDEAGTAAVGDPSADTMTPRGKPRWVSLAVVGCTVAAAVIRFVALGREGFWHDELTMAAAANRDLSHLLETIRAGRPALYPTASWLWSRVFGTSEFAIRALPALCGTLSVPALYFTARQLVGVRPAIVAAALIAVSGFHLAYGQEHRYYAMALLFAVLAIGCLLRGLRRGGRQWWVGYVVCGALAAYAHDPAVIAIACAGIGAVLAFVRRWLRWWRPVVLAHVALALLSIPRTLQYLAAKHHRAAGVEIDAAELTSWIESPPAWAPLRSLANFVMRGLRYSDGSAVLLGAAVVLVGVGWVAVRRGPAAVDAWRGLPARLGAAFRRRRGTTLVLALWLFGPMAVLLAVSWVKAPIYLDRYLITASPAWFILLGLAVVAARRVAAWPVLMAALLTAMTGPVWATWTKTDNANWREAAGVIEAGWTPGDTVAVTSDDGSHFTVSRLSDSVNWYLPGVAAVHGLDFAAAPDAAGEAARAAAGPSGRLWLLVRDNPDAASRPVAVVDRWPGVGVETHWVGHQVQLLRLSVGPQPPQPE